MWCAEEINSDKKERMDGVHMLTGESFLMENLGLCMGTSFEMERSGGPEKYWKGCDLDT